MTAMNIATMSGQTIHDRCRNMRAESSHLRALHRSMASRDLHRFLHFGWNAARYALGPFAALLIPWVVMRHGPKALWGEVVGVMIGVQLTAHLLRWGSRDLLPRLFAKDHRHIPAIWSRNLITRAILLPPALAGIWWFMPYGTAAAVWLGLLFVNQSFEPLMVQHKRFLPVFLIDAAGLALTIAGIHGLHAPSAEAVIRWVVLGQALRCVLLIATFRRDIVPATPGIDPRMHLTGAVPFLLIALSGLLGSRVDLYVVGLTMDRSTLAEYQVVQGYFVQLQALAGIIAVPFTRELYRLGRAAVLKATGRLATVGLLALLPVGLAGHLLFTRLYGFDTGPRECVAGCLMGWPVFAYTPLVQTIYRHGREMDMVRAGFITSAVSAGLTWWLVPVMGVTGGLMAAAMSQFLMLAATHRVFRRIGRAAR